MSSGRGSETTTSDFLDAVLDSSSIFAGEINEGAITISRKTTEINENLERILESKTYKMKKKKLHSSKNNNKISTENSEGKQIINEKLTLISEKDIKDSTATIEEIPLRFYTQRNLLQKPLSHYTSMLKG